MILLLIMLTATAQANNGNHYGWENGKHNPHQEASIPEPSTVGLLAVGGLVLWRMKK